MWTKFKRLAQQRPVVVWGLIGLILLVVIVSVAGGGKHTKAHNNSSASQAVKLYPPAPNQGNYITTPASAPTTTAAPATTTTEATVPQTTTTTHPLPPTTTAPYVAPPTTAIPVAPAGCHPLSSAGNCYEAGEFCSDADHGTSGVAGNGAAISCENEDGWRWVDS